MWSKQWLVCSGSETTTPTQIKELKKKLCRHGKLNTIEWYDEPLPELNVMLKGIRPLKLPADEEDQ